jgi:hypothetical protein
VEAEEASDDGVVTGMAEEESDEPREGKEADVVESNAAVCGLEPAEEEVEAGGSGAVAGSGDVVASASVAAAVAAILLSGADALLWPRS